MEKVLLGTTTAYLPDVDLNGKDEFGRTALDYIFMNASVAVNKLHSVQSIISFMVKKNASCNSSKLTPLCQRLMKGTLKLFPGNKEESGDWDLGDDHSNKITVDSFK